MTWHRLAARELRQGFGGFRLFIACLALGVAAIAAIGSFAAAVEAGLRADGRRILGGDLELRQVHRPIPAEVRSHLDTLGRVGVAVEMRAMARAGERRTLVELKAVDDRYPLVGAVESAPDRPLAELLAARDGSPGALLDPLLLDRLQVAIGDPVRIGEATFTVRGAVLREPDSAASGVAFGPRVLVHGDALPATGLIQPGSLVAYHYRVALDDPAGAAAVAADLGQRYPDAAWRLRNAGNAAPGLAGFVRRIALYLTLVGLTALLVGGVGVANAIRSYLAGRTQTIATLKCLGADGATVFATYLAVTLAMATVGTLIGLAIGAALPALVLALFADALPVPTRIAVFPLPLAVAAAFGLLTAFAFALWPLARAREIRPTALFRDLVEPGRRRPRALYVALTGVALVALAAMAVVVAGDRSLALWFVAGAIGAFGLFHLAAAGVGWLASVVPHPRRPHLRLALANLHRPGAPTASVVLSLGLGLTTLVAVALVQGNLSRQVTEAMPETAPTFFFIDLQPDQVAGFDALVDGHPGVTAHARVPALRGRITRLNGVPVGEAEVAPEAQWALRNERGLTYARTPPPGSEIVAGSWWPADHAGPPLISFDADIAAGMGLGVGDTLTVNVLGREVTATIANLRRIRWTSLAINFTIVFAPGTLEGAPQTHIATVRIDPDQEGALLAAVTDRFVNVSAIRVRDALEAVEGVLASIGEAAGATAALTLLAGLLVLAGAIAASQHRRIREAVVLKVVGATRRDLLVVHAVEYGLLGLATAAIAAVLGTLAAWLVLTQAMRAPWTFLPGPVAATVAIAVLITVAMGFAGSWRALGRRPAPVLRNP